MFGSNSVIDSIAVEGHEIAFVRRPGGDRYILFLHGLGCSKESFGEAFAGSFFSDQFTLISPDLVGYGHSSKDAEFSYDLEAQAEVLAGLLHKLSVNKLAIIAHSMGNVPGLLLTQAGFDLFGYFSLEGNLRLADCSISKRVAKVSEDDFINKLWPLAPLQFRCRGSLREPAVSPTAYYRSARSLVTWSSGGRLLPLFKSLAVTKAYLYGERSSMADLGGILGGQWVVEIPECGHFLMNEKPELTYGKIATRLNVQ